MYADESWVLYPEKKSMTVATMMEALQSLYVPFFELVVQEYNYYILRGEPLATLQNEL